ncbi:HAD family hydrolase [Halohasta litorea]|uniref:HAD family hydrolase n=1 Tax=Halohasta litorea TaxID=869891 RepID=A0ABD6D291_9EURY|nr:HAD family phosphatase [Halohasta litorea]
MADDGAEITAVLFDMDGVIVDSERYWHDEQPEHIFPQTLEGEQPELEETTGMYYKEIYDYLDEEYETTISKEEFVDLFDEVAMDIYHNRVELLDGFHETREELADRDIPVAIVTSSPSSWHDIVIDRFDIDVDEIITAENLDADGKPAPDIYEKAAEIVGHAPENCLVAEDSKNGIESAERAGAVVVGYRAEHNSDTDLSAADVVAEDSEELHEAILSRAG